MTISPSCHFNFNPRSRVGSDGGVQRAMLEQQRISIHAPAWGATMSDAKKLLTSKISIHAPAWGATSITDKNIDICKPFFAIFYNFIYSSSTYV